MSMTPVPPNSLQIALDHVAKGGRLCVPTAMRVTIIAAKNIATWDKAGTPLLRERDNGYQMRVGKSSVYLLPGQLKMID